MGRRSGSVVFTPARIGGLRLRNRPIRAGCYEGLSREGRVTGELVERHRRLAAGGLAMTTLGYCAVSADGRAFGEELWARAELLPGLRRLVDVVHAGGRRPPCSWCTAASSPARP